MVKLHGLTKTIITFLAWHNLLDLIWVWMHNHHVMPDGTIRTMCPRTRFVPGKLQPLGRIRDVLHCLPVYFSIVTLVCPCD